MSTFSFSTLANNKVIPFDPLLDVLYFDTITRPAELLINGTASGVQFSVGGKSIVLTNISLDDLGISSATGLGNVQFVSPGALLVGEGTTAHDGAVANVITGGTGDDALLGLGGNDTLDGGAGGDLMVGGQGDDTYKVDNASDVVSEGNAAEGTDLVLASVSFTLSNYVENLTLVGTGGINATGNTGANMLTGNTGDNVLDGKTGADTMIGGDGNDTYFVDNTFDKVTESNISATQIDTVNSTLSYALGANLENLVLIGAGSTVGVGNYLNNQITGNAGGNTINGGKGADTMTGGDGNDIYIVNSASDVVQETSNSPGQIDMVASTVSYTLGANLENLRLLGTADISATGNALNNTLYANAGNNVLDGQGGNDTVSYEQVSLLSLAASSATTLTVTSSVTTVGVTVDLTIAGYQDTQGSGFDKLVGIQNLIGSQFNDELTGNAGNNMLDGNTGADVLTGGKGNDTYVVDGADVVVELAGAAEGIDTVLSSVSYRLTDNVEYLTLTDTAVSGIGNNLDNRLVGTSGNNVLDGRAGADKMDGGAGNDTFVVDNLGDEVTDSTGSGDLVMSYINYTLGSTIENLRLMGTNALNGNGNALNNIVWANIGDNAMDGGSDVLVSGVRGDTLSFEYGATAGIILDLSNTAAQATGGSGTDTVANFEHLIGSNYDDTLSGNSGINTLDGLTGVDTVSYASATAGVTIDLADQTATTVTASGNVVDTVRNFDNIIGSSFDDTLIGNVYDNTFDGGSGYDTVSYQNVGLGDGGVVVSLAILGAQNTVASGFDSFISTPNTTRSSVENLTGSVNDDSLTGDAYANKLDGSAGDDTLHAAAGNDSLVGGDGDDLMDGGAGLDTAFYQGSTSVVVNLNLTVAQDTGAGMDTLMSIENVTSGAGDDNLVGNTGNNALDGGAGNDLLQAGSGSDSLTGGFGNDLIDGGAGIDTAFFLGTDAATVNLSVTVAQNTGYGLDILAGIENATSGDGNDMLAGNAGVNFLKAGAGDDTISGGLGSDQLTGGSGTDTFVFDTALGPANADQITDFNVTDDTIRLANAVFAGLATGALAASAFAANLTGAAGDATDRIIYETDTGKLFFDADGFGAGAAVQFATVSPQLALTNADFFVI